MLAKKPSFSGKPPSFTISNITGASRNYWTIIQCLGFQMTYILSLRPVNHFINWTGKTFTNMLLRFGLSWKRIAWVDSGLLDSSLYLELLLPKVSIWRDNKNIYDHFLLASLTFFLLFCFFLTKCLTLLKMLSFIYYILIVYCLSSSLECNLHKQSLFCSLMYWWIQRVSNNVLHTASPQ